MVVFFKKNYIRILALVLALASILVTVLPFFVAYSFADEVEDEEQDEIIFIEEEYNAPVLYSAVHTSFYWSSSNYYNHFSGSSTPSSKNTSFKK